MSSVRVFQEQLLAIIKQGFGPSMPDALQTAFMDIPRHHFVQRYRLAHSAHWHDVHNDNLEQHLAALYQDRPVILDGEDNNVRSTISQPGLVMKMLNMLRVEPGHRIVEIGTASGWNAALLGRLAGNEGRVFTVEIIPELALRARNAIAAIGIDNVTVVEGDGGLGCALGAPYDRVIFTVGAYDIPKIFYSQVAEGGLLLMVLKHRGGGDTLHVFRKQDSCFESIESLPCGFVPLTGEYRMPEMDPITLEEIPYWKLIKDNIVERRPFWWGGQKGSGPHFFTWKTMGFRALLSIVMPDKYEVFAVGDKLNPADMYFGLCDSKAQSVVVIGNDTLTTYGSHAAGTMLRTAIAQWVALGMPGGANFELSAFPVEEHITPGEQQWLTRRRDTQYLWQLQTLE